MTFKTMKTMKIMKTLLVLSIAVVACEKGADTDVKSLRMVDSVAETPDALDAAAVKERAEMVSAPWKPGFIENSELGEAPAALDLMKSTNMSFSKLIASLPECAKSAIATGAVLKVDGPSVSIDFTLPAAACAGEVNNLHLVYAVRCLNGASLTRFKAMPNSAFLESPAAELCYKTKTGVLFELRKDENDKRVAQVFNDRNKGLCAIDYAAKDVVVSDACQSVSSTVSQ